MSRLNDFIVNITLATAPEQVATFGNILIFTADVVQPFATYANITDVLVDFADTTDTYKMADQLFKQTPAPSKVAVLGEITAITAEMETALSAAINEDWMILYSTESESASITALSAWALANGKYYAATTQDLALFTTLADKNTFLQYHSTAGTYLAESLLTYLIVRPIGSCTPKFKQLENMGESVITDAELSTLHTNNGGTYIKDMGVIQTTNSKGQSGEYYDVVLGAAWIKSEMESNLRNLAVSVGKIPYSNTGIAMIINVVENALKQAAINGIVAVTDDGNPSYSISYKKREDVTLTDRALRKYADVIWSADLSGAIENGTIGGTLTV